jgi:hypothetical protein
LKCSGVVEEDGGETWHSKNQASPVIEDLARVLVSFKVSGVGNGPG